jgi:biopolymer transport protein ExbD
MSAIKKTSKRGHSTMSELNITPLLDLVFVLLVIFIITTPQLVNNLEMTLPSGKPPQTKQPKPKINQILVDDTGQAFLNNAAYDKAGLKQELARLKDEDPENMAVEVHGSDEVAYQGMINVLDVLQQLDITKVALATH